MPQKAAGGYPLPQSITGGHSPLGKSRRQTSVTSVKGVVGGGMEELDDATVGV